MAKPDFLVHLIVPNAEGRINVPPNPLNPPGGMYNVVCDNQMHLPTGSGQYALTAFPPAATCEKCKKVFRDTMRAPDQDEPEPELESTPQLEG